MAAEIIKYRGETLIVTVEINNTYNVTKNVWVAVYLGNEMGILWTNYSQGKLLVAFPPGISSKEIEVPINNSVPFVESPKGHDVKCQITTEFGGSLPAFPIDYDVIAVHESYVPPPEGKIEILSLSYD